MYFENRAGSIAGSRVSRKERRPYSQACAHRGARHLEFQVSNRIVTPVGYRRRSLHAAEHIFTKVRFARATQQPDLLADGHPHEGPVQWAALGSDRIKDGAVSE